MCRVTSPDIMDFLFFSIINREFKINDGIFKLRNVDSVGLIP